MLGGGGDIGFQPRLRAPWRCTASRADCLSECNAQSWSTQCPPRMGSQTLGEPGFQKEAPHSPSQQRPFQVVLENGQHSHSELGPEPPAGCRPWKSGLFR